MACVPDLPGCFSPGDSLDVAVANAEEAILLYLEDVTDAGRAPPVPPALEKVRRREEWGGWRCAVVDVNIARLGTKATRVDFTLPDRMLDTIGRDAKQLGETRSGFLAGRN